MDPSQIRWGQEFYNVPIQALNVSSRRRLEMYLNVISEIPNSQNMPADWTGLAELMEFEYLEIQNFDRDRSPTLGVLQAYSNQEGASVGALLDKIKELERSDIIMDCFKNIDKDVTVYLNKQRPCQDPDVSTSVVSNALVVQDVMQKAGTIQPFHAFVSSCPEDFKFVQQLIEELEVNHGLSLCIPERDLLGGSAKYVVTAELIEKRCWRTILVLSPNYLRSVECDFEIKFTQALNPGSQGKKIVPVMCDKSDVPSILKFITVLDHTRLSVQGEPKWFWIRLAASLKLPPDWTEEENAYANMPTPLIYPIRNSEASFPSSSPASSNSSSTQSSMSASHTPSSDCSSRQVAPPLCEEQAAVKEKC